MKIVVLKFGGTSVGTINRIKKVADIISNYKKKKYKVIVVNSAMSGVTNDLVIKSKKISKNFSASEYDVLVSSGEQVASSLIAGRLIHKGLKSRSWLAWQIPILTEGSHNKPPPHPISRILIFFNGLFLFFKLNALIILFFIYAILIGLNLCNGLNLPSGFHHSSAILENFSISFLFIVLDFIFKLILYLRI